MKFGVLLAAVFVFFPGNPPEDFGHQIQAQAPAPAAVVQAADGKIILPAEVAGPVTGFIQIQATTEGETVRWLAIDPGLNMFPSHLLKSSKFAVVSAPRAGKYRVIAWTAIGGTPTEAAVTVVVVGTPKPVDPDPVDPDPVDPDPVDPDQDFSGLAEKVRALAADRPAPERAAAAAVYEKMAAAGHATTKELVAATTKALIEALGINAYDGWYAFRVGLARELSSLKSAGSLSDKNAAEAWLAIAGGLK